MGACDDDTDGTGIGGWAGLNGHVAIECRPPVFIDGGVGNIVQPHVQHPPVTTASAGKPLAVYGTFRLNFHHFDWFKLDLRGHTQPRGAAFSCLRLK